MTVAAGEGRRLLRRRLLPGGRGKKPVAWRAPIANLHAGIDEGRFALGHEQVLSAVALLSAATLAAMSLVLEGHRTWRDAGSDAAELVLRGLGIPRD